MFKLQSDKCSRSRYDDHVTCGMEGAFLKRLKYNFKNILKIQSFIIIPIYTFDSSCLHFLMEVIKSNIIGTFFLLRSKNNHVFLIFIYNFTGIQNTF